MLRHVALFSFAADVTPARIDDAAARIAALATAVPTVRALHIHRDLGLDPRSAALAVTADFDDEAGWHAYQAHPAHRAVVSDVLGPILASRAAIQFPVG